MVKQNLKMVKYHPYRPKAQFSSNFTLSRDMLDGMRDYCQLETFKPQCWQSEVIVIKEAFYGRRRASRCTESEGEEFARNPRYFGCSADVAATLHSRCSGRKQCEVRIPDPELENTGACVVGLRMFLEASYYCAEGTCTITVYVAYGDSVHGCQ